MDAIKKMKSKTACEVAESCLETVRVGWERTLSRALEWTLHPTEEDALSELARSELVFLALISALSSLDAEMSCLLLKEVDKWTLFPRLASYMAGKLEAEWRLPRRVLERAAKFAAILDRSGLFDVPQELHRYLAQLLSQEEAGGSEDCTFTDQVLQVTAAILTTSLFRFRSKRPRKDPRLFLSQQGADSSTKDQVSDWQPHQVGRVRLVARRRKPRCQEDRGRRKKGKQASLHQQALPLLPQEMARPSFNTISEPNKIQTSACSQIVDKPATGAISKVREALPSPPQKKDKFTFGTNSAATKKQTSESLQKFDKPATGVTQKVRLTLPSPPQETVKFTFGTTSAATKKQSSTSLQKVDKPTTGVISKVRQTFPSPSQESVKPAFANNPATNKKQTSASLQKHDKPATGVISKVRQTLHSPSQETLKPTFGTTPETSKKQISPCLQKVEKPATGVVSKVRQAIKAEPQDQLWEGVRRDDDRLIESAVLSGADLEDLRVDKMTPLGVAAFEGRERAARALLRLGAGLERRDGQLMTALLWAAAGGHLGPARLLVEAGADLDARTSSGITPLTVALLNERTEVAEYLQSVGAPQE